MWTIFHLFQVTQPVTRHLPALERALGTLTNIRSAVSHLFTTLQCQARHTALTDWRRRSHSSRRLVARPGRIFHNWMGKTRTGIASDFDLGIGYMASPWPLQVARHLRDFSPHPLRNKALTIYTPKSSQLPHVHVHFGCAGSRNTCGASLACSWSAAF